MNPLMEQLHDIEGLDPISWWPLAISSWILVGIVLAILSAILALGMYRLTFKRSWKNDTFQKLSKLEENLSAETAKETIMLLSEYLRRIALKRYSRKECAGLTGEAWLKWLSLNDPNNFEWEKRGILLIEMPYAPENPRISTDQIKNLIRAVREWVL